MMLRASSLSLDNGDPRYKFDAGLTAYAPRTSVDPLYTNPKAPWRNLAWIDFLKTIEAARDASFAIPNTAHLRPTPIEIPIPPPPTPWSTGAGGGPRTTTVGAPPKPGEWHYSPNGTLRKLAPADDGRSVTITGELGGSPWTLYAKAESDPATKTITITFDPHRTVDTQESGRPQPYTLTIPLPTRATSGWTVNLQQTSGLPLGHYTWP